MKVIIHYEDNDNPELHKSLKITLPKSWKTGPTSKILGQFVESYNANETLGGANPLQDQDMHLAIYRAKASEDGGRELVALCSDAIVVDEIPDRADLYLRHGASETLQQVQDRKDKEVQQQKDLKANTVQCTHFGCQQRFPPGGPYPACVYHCKPPVFHETVKFWSCCPEKKAYDWESFQNIPGCQTGTCTEVREDNQKLFLGGTDLRQQAGEAVQLKSIDDFNKAQAAGGAEAAPVLDRLRSVMGELGIENELYNQVIQGIETELNNQQFSTKAECLDAVKKELGNKLKTAMKSIAAEQQRIK